MKRSKYRDVKAAPITRRPQKPTAAAVEQMLKSIGRDDMPNVTIAAPKRGGQSADESAQAALKKMGY